MKKIIHIFHSFQMGGAQYRLMQYLDYTKNDDAQHFIFACNGDYSLLNDWNVAADKPIIYDKINYKKHDILGNIIRFRAIFKQKIFTHIQTQNWTTIEAVIANTPHILPHIHNEDGFGTDESVTLKTRRNIIRRLFLIGKTLCVPSQTLYDIAKKHWITPFTDCHYIPNGIADLQVNTQIKPIFTDKHKIIIGTVAVLRQEKNLHLLIKTTADLIHIYKMNVGLVIVGDGSEKQFLIRSASEYGLTENDIYFAGYQGEYQNYLNLFDIFALSSKTEQQPYSILQAMNLQKPIISTPAGDVFNMVCTDNQEFVGQDMFNPPYAQFQKLIHDADLRHHLGQLNKQHQIQHYSLEQSLKERQRLFK